MKYFDSHSHYYDERFSEEYEGGAEALLSSNNMENVSYIINVGTAPETCRAAVEQAKKHENMYTALGIHPSDARFIDDFDTALEEIVEMIKDKESKCVALGEIGLDYHYPETDKEMQMALFRRQMKIADELSLPVVIHDRDSHEDVMTVIREFPNVKGILHSFSGSAEMACELVKLGYTVSFSGTVTFKNARKPKEAAAAVPLERLLIETDAPYLAPHPKRGTLNHSGNLKYTNRALAEIKGISEEEMAEITEANARRIFKI
ncbi:MAG: TatD family deoxyribonuclease [Ruminococcaceae bacterium]|nr:TatD family deoxyribonuclease [Oscillospiraceae bacterium]